MGVKVYTVKGMSCAHCRQAVERALREVPGVTEVEVDLATGRVTVAFAGDPDDQAVRRAVEEAGYEVA